MARALKFILNGEEQEVPIEKVDRKKVYGWADKKAIDRDANECFFGSISDGMYIFGKESFESCYVDESGQMVDKADLKLVDHDGNELVRIESSFKQVIELDETVSVDEYLNYVARSVYQLAVTDTLLDAVKAADGIFTFKFNYNASYDPDTAFLIHNEGGVFMIVGEDCQFDFVGLEQGETAVLVEDEEDDDEDDDSMDFGMF